MGLFLNEIVAKEAPVVVEVLVENAAGRAFWAACGFEGYALTLISKPDRFTNGE
jgi:hypothetical protein